MKLLLLTQDFPPKVGGVETYSFELAQRFNKSMEFFGVLAPTHDRAEQLDQKLPYLVKRVPIKDSLLPLAAPLALCQMMGKYSFDAVFHAQWQTVIASLISQKITGFPKHIYVAAHARELLIEPFAGQQGLLSKQMHRIRKMLLQHADAFFPVSRYTAELLKKEGIPDKKIHIVGNGTDPDIFRPEPTEKLRKKMGLKDKRILFSVCRLVPRKGIDLVLKALKQIINSHSDIIYLIGGTGKDKERLQRLVSEYGLEEYVYFLGRIPDDQLPSYYSLADIFVMPAKNDPPDVEGFGIVFLEANACETPVVGSRTGGIPDAIIDGKTGFLVEEDNIDQLGAKLIELINNPELAYHMGVSGRNRILNEATWDHVANALMEKMQ